MVAAMLDQGQGSIKVENVERLHGVGSFLAAIKRLRSSSRSSRRFMRSA
jgi:hypothetical protein